MLYNYLILALRNLKQRKAYSFINIVGLAFGMSCCLLLWLYISSELSFDQHHQRAEGLYLVNSEAFVSGTQEEYPMLSAPFAAALKSEFPEVVQVARLLVNPMERRTLLQLREPGKPVQSFYQEKGYFVDSSFFELFTYQFREGRAAAALQAPNAIVLSEGLAAKLFGDAPALGRLIRIPGVGGNDQDFKVTGVYRDESSRSHIDAQFFLPMSAGWVGDWLRYQAHNFASNNLFYTYLRLRPGASAASLEKKLPAFMDKYARREMKEAGFDKRIFLLPLAELHLYEGVNTIVSPTSSKSYLYILATIALFTLLIACINFMNLSTAAATKRAREVGVRKVLGASRSTLIRQFMGEAMFIALLAMLLALGLLIAMLPAFGQLTGKLLTASALLQAETLLAIGLLTLFTGLLAGSYPAFYLSAFRPVQVLKGRLSNALSALGLRRGLVVFQFVISVGLVSATIVIQEQMDYIRQKPLGFTQDEQLVIPLHSQDARKAYRAFKSEIQKSSAVKGAAGSMYYPGIDNPTSYSLYRPDQSVQDMQPVKINQVDPDFLEVVGFQPLQGRMFSASFPADTLNSMVVNEATLRAFNIPLENAVGQKLNMQWEGSTQSFEIIGVVKDFHFQDLHHSIQPYAFLSGRRPTFNYIIAHVEGADMGRTLAFMKEQWRALGTEEPFEYSFLQEDFQKNYGAEARISRIIGYFTGVSIVISCLGLFGLAAFEARQRTKEIGIRKVLGASVGQVVAMLTKDFIKLVLVALLIATPLAWYAMHRWLQDFAYKIEIQWWMFGLAGAAALGIALCTLSFHTIKAATANPVKNLRTE